MDRLILHGITQPGTLELCEGLTSLGRNPTNDFRVHDPTVSSFHCELIVSQQTVLVRDLNSTNGTFVDGEKVRESFLRPWQILRLGQVEFRLEVETVTEEPNVQIPELPKPQIEEETRLLDGRLGCLHHPGVPAIVRCSSCGKAYCGECVKPLGLKGREKRLFCPGCSSPCEPLVDQGKRKKKSLLGRLTQTIRIKFQ